MDLEYLINKDIETMETLKDFQCATVERVAELFENGQNRVLVADEVGMGKTLIARGVISKTAIIQCKANDDLFKIVYICSNQVIAKQNIQKLDVFNLSADSGIDDTRLSMQHLKIAEQEFLTKENGDFAQLIPLTPSTSFVISRGGGTRCERALMLCVLRRIEKLKGYIDSISEFLSRGVTWWPETVCDYEKRIRRLESANTGYPQDVIGKILDFDTENHILDSLINHVKELQSGIEPVESDARVLGQLRTMFAVISMDMLQPDLVIMDEFQRFRQLIGADSEGTENGMLAKKFFETPDLKVLLLSATPYKLYSTYEEIEDADNPNEYYDEFTQVMEFLMSNDPDRTREFSEVWSKYSIRLKELIQGGTAVLVLKDKAEDAMYNLMCRTERASVMDMGDYIDDSSTKKAVSITSGDIHTYLDMGKMLKSIDEERNMLVDYAKSCPYLMSFMNHYKVKERAENHFKKKLDDLSLAESDYLWIDRSILEHYGELPANNARLEELKRQIFSNGSELYMWVPPSNPYYELEGVYKNSKGFSKILVFSAWEMVPKMIGAMISYEEERRTVGVLSNDEKLQTGNNTYFTKASSRYPVPRLNFNYSGGEPRGMYLFCLIYPSEILAEIYHPIEYLNDGYTLNEIREQLKHKLRKLLSPLIRKYAHNSAQEDKKWYYMAPVLLDTTEYVNDWINEMWKEQTEDESEDDEDESRVSRFKDHLEQLSEYLKYKNTKLGRVPSDLLDVLADMSIGSFAVCAYRANGGDAKRASELARVLINRFNSTEATAAVIMSYSDDESSGGHWRNVLRYCCDGGFGAMLDEYVHMVSEGTGFGLSEDKNQAIHDSMMNALRIHSATYPVETYPAFCRRMQKEKTQRTSMRSHYAVAFTNDGLDSKSAGRKDSLRNAFNSPMRPFVLATTSIGQEGLDFHYYCRKIMHWNLPSNPIDLEQREGRINRYKCLAIRQDIAKRFSDRKFISDDIWDELFSVAAKELRNEDQSELVPYWSLGKDQHVKIERIIPMYPVSKDQVNYRRLMEVLSLYRLTMGQTRQEELVDFFIDNKDIVKEFKSNLFINLSPYTRTNEEWRARMKSREPVVSERKKTAWQKRIEDLRVELSTLRGQLTELESEMSSLKQYAIEGMRVTHSAWGDGIVKTFDGERILVKFGSEDKIMSMPKAFTQGFLKSEFDDFTDNWVKKDKLNDKEKAIKAKIEEVEAELNRLEI